MFAFQACVAIWLTYYFWSNQAYRQAVFKFSPRTSAEEKDYRLKYFAKKEVADTDLVYGHKELVIIFLTNLCTTFSFSLKLLGS